VGFVVETLTARELVILEWLATPLTQARIASELFVSVNTVKSHIGHIYRKLGVSSRGDAVERARALDLLNDELPATFDFEALVEHSRALITVINADRKLVWANRAYRELLGGDPDHQVGRPALEIVHPDDRDRLTGLFYEVSARPGGSVTFECRLAHADGTWRHVEVHQVNRLHDPAVRGFVGTTRELPARSRNGA
jgi:PAS domain S-box-containing protein